MKTDIPWEKKINVLTCSHSHPPQSLRQAAIRKWVCQPTSYSHLHQECFSWVFLFIKKKNKIKYKK